MAESESLPRRSKAPEPFEWHDEYMVCHAVGYPDPFLPWPNTRENAQRFAAEHKGARTVVKHRIATQWQELSDGA